MFLNAQGFVVEDGSFNEAQYQHVDHSTNYQITNISFSSEALHPKAGASANDLGYLNPEALISKAKLLVEAAKNGSSSTPEGSADGSTSSSTPSANGSTVIGAIERPVLDPIPVPEPPVKDIQEVEKRLTIYTGVDNAQKRLKRSISV